MLPLYRPSDTMDLLQLLDRDRYPMWSYQSKPVDTFEKPYTLLQTQMKQERSQQQTLLLLYRVILIGLCGLVGAILVITLTVLDRLRDTKKCGG